MVTAGMKTDLFAISNAFGPPLNKSTWSGAPANVATALERHGLRAVGIDTSLNHAARAACAALHLLRHRRGFSTGEIVSRGMAMRTMRARKVANDTTRLRIVKVLHTGTFDLPVGLDSDGAEHYLFCDHTWHLSHGYRPGIVSESTARTFDAIEWQIYRHCRHIFTFGKFVRDDLISHYGVSPDRVTVVGSGRGSIHPYHGPKNYNADRLLFIAKHYFAEKGGNLLIDAFRIAVRRLPRLSLTIVGGAADPSLFRGVPNIDFRSFVTWPELERLLREASLLVQPMLNDPWGQVYLEALVSRTPVLGLARNGLPEIIQDGRHGFLVDKATPQAIADAIIDAMSDPDRLAAMGATGLEHVIDTYSWDRVGSSIFGVMATD